MKLTRTHTHRITEDLAWAILPRYPRTSDFKHTNKRIDWSFTKGRTVHPLRSPEVSAPAAAPCAAVAVRCGARGALASRVGSKWMASFPGADWASVDVLLEE